MAQTLRVGFCHCLLRRILLCLSLSISVYDRLNELLVMEVAEIVQVVTIELGHARKSSICGTA